MTLTYTNFYDRRLMMSKKQHITANGVPFDMAAFRAKNELTRAVGNMNVNARGDVLDSNNNIIENRNNIVNRMYEKVMQSGVKPKRQPVDQPPKQKSKIEEEMPEFSEEFGDDIPNPKK